MSLASVDWVDCNFVESPGVSVLVMVGAVRGWLQFVPRWWLKFGLGFVLRGWHGGFWIHVGVVFVVGGVCSGVGNSTFWSLGMCGFPVLGPGCLPLS